VKQQGDDAFFSYRLLNLIGFFISGAALAYASIALEQQLSTLNCGLCTLVRLCLLSMSIIFLVAFIFNPWIFGQRLLGLFNWLIASAGLAIAGRYLWLESTQATLSDQCNTGLEPWLNLVPGFLDIKTFLSSHTQCLDNSWQVLGLSLPQVTLGLFVIMFLITWRILSRRPNPRLFY